MNILAILLIISYLVQMLLGDLSQKIVRIVNRLPENSLRLAYEMLRSIKSFSKNKQDHDDFED